ncbi:glutathione S-transferase family protein [Kordiimonas gwangyangensis]|uniref:glutathione S-transferase family protein n=1 Tax=Kordiimonas gwangyangensis TaxID=288022 RepID=UPI000380FE6C|nr:glutathione S-transferase family protein [Kordiimonas gwangyangensis]
MKLVGESVSPYFERIYIALDIKGMTDKLEFGMPEGGFKSEAHWKAHPLGKIPYLVKDDGSTLTESQVILEYLDRVLGGTMLTPEDFDVATDARALCRIMDLYYAAAVGPMGRVAFGGTASNEELAKAREEDIPRALAYASKYLGDGKYAIGDSWSIADCALISHLYWYGALMPRFGLEGFGENKKLAAYWDRIKDDPVVTRSFERTKRAYDKFFGGKN